MPKPVFVVTGPSGAGKGTLIERILPRFPDLAVAVSATTRPQRPSERDGTHYYFLTRDEFQRRIDAEEFLEWVDYVGNRYGTLRSEIDRIQARGHAPLLELELDGALTVKEKVPGAQTVFVDAPLAELERRLRARFDQRRREFVEGALAELMVVVVDLARALGSDDHERVARVHLLHQLVDAGMDHLWAIVAAVNSRSTTAASRSAACSRSSFSTT